MMKIYDSKIKDVKIIEPELFIDSRGFFFESYNEEKFYNLVGIKLNFIQDNHSNSKKNVLRGLHYQLPPFCQAKIIKVIEGEIFDVAVDLRKNSPTFGHWISEILSAENKKQLFIPEGFAHGFLTISENAQVIYKSSNIYSPNHERSIRWDDNDICINWPNKSQPILSKKDSEAPKLLEAEIYQN